MTGHREAQLFVVDPITRLRPAKDSSVALMQAAQRAGLAVWVCTQADLSTAAEGDGSHRPRAWAQPARYHVRRKILSEFRREQTGGGGY